MRAIGICALACAGACAGHVAQRPMQLRKVILYQNGIGYFERSGHVGGDTLRLAFARGELDDVLKTLTVIDRLGAGVATVDVPTMSEHDRTIGLGVRMSAGRVHDLQVSYAVPTPTWKAAYRVVLEKTSLLQGWAMVNNTSQEDWNGVALTLATGAPMSFAMDLHTPQYVSRPDATGRLVAPTVLGPVAQEKVGAVDSDGDRIVDANDKCPEEPETYNGYEDEDGCPDRGRVIVTDTSIEVLERVYFDRNGEVLLPASGPILDAIAATLHGNPDITKVEISGHASEDEADVWSLTAKRAANVRAALVQRGVEAGRLTAVPFGATRPVEPGLTELARQKNRRVEFQITERNADGIIDSGEHRIAQVRQSVRTSSTPAEVAGSVRYELGEPVSIRRGASAMVSILNKPIAAEDVYLFRPDANAPGSDTHPFRAVRLANDSGFTLEPGPIAIFSKGTFVGDGLVDRIDVGETAWIPYALDGSTTITTNTADGERPVKIVTIQRGVMTLENMAAHVTRYEIAAGRDSAQRVYIRHAKLGGYTAVDLPPGTLDQGDAYLIPLPLHAARKSTLVVEERQPVQRTIQLLDQGSVELGAYIEGSHLPKELAAKISSLVALRKELGAADEDAAALRTRLGDVASRAEEIRANLRTLAKVSDADDLRRKLLANLTAATTDAESLARQLAARMEAAATARSRLQDLVRELTL